MARDADIVARLVLNAREFKAGFQNAIRDAATDADKGGATIGERFKAGFEREATKAGADIGNIAGLIKRIGPQVVLAIGTASAATVAQSERMRLEVDALGAVLDATGRRAGFSKDQLVDFARATAAATGQSTKAVIEAEKALAAFGGIAGANFTDTITAATDLAAVFGGDVVSNADRLGKVMAALGDGEVKRLREGFAFLGDTVLDQIEAFAESGREFEAQRKLIDALAASIGDAAEGGKGAGLTGALTRGKVAIEALADSAGASISDFLFLEDAIGGVVGWLERLAGIDPSGIRLGSAIAEQLKEVEAARARLASFDSGLPGVLDDLTGGVRSTSAARREKEATAELNRLRKLKREEDQQRALDLQTAQFGVDFGISFGRDASRKDAAAEKAEKDRAKRTEKAARESARLDEQRQAARDKLDAGYAAELAKIDQQLELEQARRDGFEDEAKLRFAMLEIEEKFKGIDSQRIGLLKDRTAELIKQRDLGEDAKAASGRLDPGVLVDFDGELEKFKDAQKAVAAAEKEQRERAERDFENLADIYERAFRDGGKGIWDQFKSLGTRVLAELAAGFTLGGGIGGGIGGAGSFLASIFGGGSVPGFNGGQFPGGSLVSSLLGRGASASAAVPGQNFFTGGLVGAPAIGAPASGALGAVQEASPYIQAALAVFTIGSALKDALTTRRGSATIGGGADGLAITGTRGNSKSREAKAEGFAGDAIDEFNAILEALGVSDFGGTPSVSIGVRKKNIRVDTSGRGITKTNNGAIDFGDDAEAAIEAAVRDLLNDVDLQGISATAQRALKQTGKDLEDAVNDALRIESIPKRLKAIEDPVGAELDALNREFEELRDLLKANGASVAELADAEKLFGLERKAVFEAQEETLRDFARSLVVGSSSPLSLGDQRKTAEASFAAFEADIAAGKTIDQGKFVEAGQEFLDIERALGGSTRSFFDSFDRVQAATDRAIAGIDSVASLRTDANPFAKATADAAAATANNTSTMTEGIEKLDGRLLSIERLLGRVVGGGGVFDNRGFTRSA